MYGFKISQLKTDAGKFVFQWCPDGESKDWPSDETTTLMGSYGTAWIQSNNVVEIYSKITGNLLETYMVLGTEANATSLVNLYQQILRATAAVNPADWWTDFDLPNDSINNNFKLLMKFRREQQLGKYGVYAWNFDTNVTNMDSIDLSGYTKIDIL
jgi:hypothetical protein